MKPIVIFGAGGFAREVLELIRDINQGEPQWKVVGFLDDDEGKWGTTLNGVAVLGGVSWLDTASEPPYFVFGIGSPALKARVHRTVENRVAGFPTLVHPTVVDSTRVSYGEGVVVTAGNVLTTDITVGDFAMINLSSTVGHDSVIHSFSTLSPGVNVSGQVTIEEGCDIGTGAKIVPGVSIGRWSIIGAGAVVAADLPANCTAVGVPAKVIKQREPGWNDQ